MVPDEEEVVETTEPLLGMCVTDEALCSVGVVSLSADTSRDACRLPLPEEVPDSSTNIIITVCSVKVCIGLLTRVYINLFKV